MLQAFLITGGALVFGVVVGAAWVLHRFGKGFRR